MQIVEPNIPSIVSQSKNVSDEEETWRETAASMEEQIAHHRARSEELNNTMNVMADATRMLEHLQEEDAEIGREEYNRDGEPDVDEGYRRIEEDNETPEERVIRWAAENGGAINIGERS